MTDSAVTRNRTLLTVGEVATRLRIGLSTAYRLCRQDDFPAARVRGQIRVPSDQLDDWIERQAAVTRSATST